MIMENQDKLLEQIKSAEANAEGREFPGFDQVWSRVEDKLDNKALSKQNRKWKQWAVAASVLLVASIGYQFFKPAGTTAKETKNTVVAADTIPPVFEPENAVANAVADTTVIRKDAPQILDNSLRSTIAADTDADNLVVPPDPLSPKTEETAPAASVLTQAPEADAVKEAPAGRAVTAAASDRSLRAKGRFFQARSVRRDEYEVFDDKLNKDTKETAKKQTPLFIIDGKPIVAKSEAEYEKKLAEATAEMQLAKKDTIIYLKEPLYIINGVEYSEESLFGARPTSPYAPLNLQEEGMTTAIFTGREALRKYGDKGKNGVVVITTKNGKPAPLEAQPNRAQLKK